MAEQTLTGVTVSTAGQTTTDPGAAGDAASQASIEQGVEFAAQTAQDVATLVTQLLGSTRSSGQNADGTYQPTPYNTPLQPMMQTLGQGNPISGITAPTTSPIAEAISTARGLMGNATGTSADRFHQLAGQQAADVNPMGNADTNILAAVNQSAGAVGDSRQQMMSVIDTLNTAINALAPILSTATGQAGASSMVTQAIQIGTSILTTLIGVISQISNQQLSQASDDLSAVNADYQVDQQGAVAPTAASGPYVNGSGQAPPEFYEAMNKALDAHGITDPAARARWIAGYETLVQRESGFNPNAVNGSDVNAANGTPSGGYAQVIGPTFQAHHVPGTSTNPLDPVANLAASMHYVMDRYDVSPNGSNLQANVQQADPNRPPKGY